MRANAGYEIISAIRIGENEEIVLGHMKTRFGEQYVVWTCTYGDNYFWGHYFASFEEARNYHIEKAANCCSLEIVKEERIYETQRT